MHVLTTVHYRQVCKHSTSLVNVYPRGFLCVGKIRACITFIELLNKHGGDDDDDENGEIYTLHDANSVNILTPLDKRKKRIWHMLTYCSVESSACIIFT